MADDDVYAFVDIPGVGLKRVLVSSFGEDVSDYGSLDDCYVTLNSGKRALFTLNAEGGGTDLSERNQRTGILEGGVISIASGTTVDWTSGSGIVSNYANPEIPVITTVPWDAVSGYTPTNIATDGTTLFGYDSVGSLVEILSTAVTIGDSHNYIFFASVTHLSGAIVSVVTAPGNIGYDGLGSYSDFINLIIGAANVDGNIYGANGVNLNVDVIGGNAYIIGSNFRTDAALSDIVTLPSTSVLTFTPMHRTANPGLSMIYGTPTTSIDPDNYDDGSGTLATTTTGYWTIQRIFRGRTGSTFVAYGQQEFSTKELALEALGSEPFTEKDPLQFMLFRCSLVVQEGATDLSDTAQAEFFEQSSFRITGARSSASTIPGVTSPGGSDTQLQYNNGGTFGGAANITYSGTSLDFADNTPLRFGLGNDFTIVHNETDTLFVSATGDMEFYNTDVTGLIFFTLGTDTAATSFQVRDNSANPLFEVFGDGKVTLDVLYPENVVGYIKNGETGFAERHISTGDFSATTIPLTATGIIYGAWWGKEGTRLYVTTADAYIYQYNLTVPYDITTATFTASNNFVDPNNSEGFTLWNDDGTVFYHGGRGYRAITLTSAWEISGIASDTGNLSLSFQDPINMYDLRWNFDGTKVIGVGDSINQAQRQSFIEWDCTTPYDLTTTTATDANIYPFPTGVPDGSLIVKGFDISPDGTRVYLSSPSTGIEYEVVLETAWDLSSGTLVNTITRTSHTDILNYSMAPDASGMASVTPAGLIVQKKYGLEFDGNLIVNDGNVGIGTSTPNAPLQFENVSANKKIVLGGTGDNDHEFLGFGVSGVSLRYQVDSADSDHTFYAASSPTISNELMRITGDGNVGIGTSTPNAPLEFAQVQAFKKIVLYGEANDNEFYGFGVQGGRFIYQVDSVSADHVFFAATSPASSQELFKIDGSGNSVTIGAAGTGGRFAFTKSALDSSLGLYSGTSGGSSSHVFYNSTPAIAADIIYDETNNNFSISTEASVDLILATGAGANIGVNKPIPVSTLHISEGTTTSDATTGTTFEQIGLGSAVTHYVRTLTSTVFSSGIDEDDVYKISNDYGLGTNTDIAINTESNIDFKNSIATPYGGFGRLQNILLWSEDTANTTVWTAIAAQVVVTGDQAIAPDGTLTADEWAYTGTIGLALRNFSFSLAQGATYTVSFWARALVSDRVVRVDLGDGTVADITVLVTDDLQRYSATMVAGASNWIDITNASAFASTIYVWGFQVNEGTELLPYARTESVQVHGSGPESGLAINHSAIFSTIAAPNYSEGTVFYDDGDKALSYYNEDSNVTVGIGRDLLVRVQNDQGVTISSGEAVYINGSSAGLPTVKLARSDSSVTSQFAGIVTETLVLNGEIGYVSTFGLIEFLNTSAWSAGDELYLSSTVAGALTNVPPADPNHIVSVAHVVTSDLITGSIQVHTPERIAPDVLYSSIYSPITAPTHTEGQLYYDDDDKSLSYQTSSTDVTINIGKEIVVPPQISNDQGVAITNGQAVYVSGSTGTYPQVKLAQANADATAHSVGLITETSIANGATGYCTTYGLVRGFNTVAWAAGDVLYLSPTVAGGLQNTKPVFPNLAIRIGIVISSASDGTIWVTYPTEEMTTGSSSTTRSFAFSDSGAADSSYLAGYYEAPTSSTQLTIGGASSITYGTANVAYGAHAFCVASAAGGTDLVLTVSGTSVNDAGVRTTSDSEILVADTDTAITDQYFETTKKWVGQIVYELTGAAGSFTFNYGFCKYEDFGNRDFTVVDFEFVGKSGVNASNMNIELLLHSDVGWTYNNTSFVPGGTTIVSLGTDYSIDNEIAADEYFAYKRGSLSQLVLGAGSGHEGVIIRYTQTTNNSVDYGTAHIGVLI